MAETPDTNHPVRVMIVIARLNIGGPAVHVILLAEQLALPEFDTTLVCGHIGPGEGDMAYLAEQRGIQPVYISQLGRELSPLRDMVALIKLWRLMRRTRPDIVHTHTAKAGFVGRIAAWLACVPVRVHTFHGHVFHGYFSPRKTQVFLWLERLTARITDRLITISPGLRDELAQTYRIAPAGKFAVVPLGMELAPLAETPRHQGRFRAEFQIPADAPLIGIVGRIVAIKNHDMFLRMAHHVRATRPDAHFAIIGDGDLRSSVETTVDDLNLRDTVRFAGWQPDLTAAYSDMDVLVISSDNEGTPATLIEAMAAGVQVVSTDVGGVRDVLHDGAYGQIVPPHDAGALASAVLTALSGPHPQQATIRAAMVEEYGMDRLRHDLGTLYRTLLAAKRSGRSA